MPSTIYLVTGGARSGKSGYAQRLCERICSNPVYLATSKQEGDTDFAARVKRHQQERGESWETVEESLTPSKLVETFKGRAVLVDCITLWLTNYFMQEGVFDESVSGGDTQSCSDEASVAEKSERALTKIQQEFDRLTEPWNIHFVVVTNELGSGTHASTNAARKFVDCQGWFNQYVAQKACRVVHMVCGVPNVVKDDMGMEPRNPLKCPALQQRDEATILDKFLSARGQDMDPKGYFMIKNDPSKAVIRISYHSCIMNDKGDFFDLDGNKISCCDGSKSPEPLKVWECRTAKELTTEVFEKWQYAKDVVSVGHAAYIGREAQRAEHCLYSGTFYQQD